MIVTTCGAAGAAGAFGGAAGFGDGAGVCAAANVNDSSAALNNVTRCNALKFILLLLTRKSLLQDSKIFQDYQTRFGVN